MSKPPIRIGNTISRTYRMSQTALKQLEELTDWMGSDNTTVIHTAIDRLWVATRVERAPIDPLHKQPIDREELKDALMSLKDDPEFRTIFNSGSL